MARRPWMRRFIQARPDEYEDYIPYIDQYRERKYGFSDPNAADPFDASRYDRNATQDLMQLTESPSSFYKKKRIRETNDQSSRGKLEGNIDGAPSVYSVIPDAVIAPYGGTGNDLVKFKGNTRSGAVMCRRCGCDVSTTNTKAIKKEVNGQTVYWRVCKGNCENYNMENNPNGAQRRNKSRGE